MAEKCREGNTNSYYIGTRRKTHLWALVDYTFFYDARHDILIPVVRTITFLTPVGTLHCFVQLKGKCNTPVVTRAYQIKSAFT